MFVYMRSVEKTAFVTSMGKYHFVPMLFGHQQSFGSRLMNTVLAGITDFTVDGAALARQEQIQEWGGPVHGIKEKIKQLAAFLDL